MKKLKPPVFIFLLFCSTIVSFNTIDAQNRYGVIDTNGNIVVEEKYTNYGHFSDGLATVEIDEKWGAIDKMGNLVIEAKFSQRLFFSEGMAHFKTGLKYGLINKKGKIVVKPFADRIGSFHDGLAFFKIDGKFGYINKKGDVVIEAKYDETGNFNDGIALVKINKLYGFINIKGDLVIPTIYKWARGFNEGFAPVQNNLGWMLIDKTGKETVLNDERLMGIKSIYNFQNGLAIVNVNGKEGFVNTKGEVVIAPQYLDVSSFNSNVTKVSNVKDQYFLIDKNNKQVGTSVDKCRCSFNDGLARFKTGEKTGFINTLGEIVIEEKYEEADDFSEGLAFFMVKSGSVFQKTSSGGIQYSSYALDIFNNLGCMAIYVGDTMYVVLVKGKDLGNIDVVSARAAAKVGVTNFKYQWFSGNNCEGLKAQYGSVFNVRCGYELSLD